MLPSDKEDIGVANILKDIQIPNPPRLWGGFFYAHSANSILTFIVFIGLASQKEKRKPVAPQSEIGNLAGLELQGQFVCDKGDELRVRGFSLGIADCIPEKSLQRVQVTSVPGHFDGVADGSFYPTGVVWNVFATWGYNTLVMALITSISLTAMIMASLKYW